MNSNNFSRIEINLLPPELAPGPAVRLLVLLNFTMIAVTLATILVHSAFTLSSIAVRRTQCETMQGQVDSLQPIVENHQTLKGVKDAVDQYGRIVCLASAEYIEIPLFLDRISKLLPEGVYLRQVQNRAGRANAGNKNRETFVSVALSASKSDPQLVIDTLRSFKSDPLFQDCFLGMAEDVEKPLEDLLNQYGIAWQVSGPEFEAGLLTNEIDFEIQTRVDRPVATPGAPVKTDFSQYLASIEFKVPPPRDDKRKGNTLTTPISDKGMTETAKSNIQEGKQ